ncbi:MAG: hypothetical protein H6975_07390 [Gammaproteobacteria bacterium]|nr:hypothetical protein [Gammaproteobacteria bacterium]
MKLQSHDRLTAFQLLSCRVEIRHEDPALANTLRYLAGNAQQTLRLCKILRYEIQGSGPYLLLEEGDFLEAVGTREDVLHVIYTRVYRRMLERFVLAGWTVLHGAVAKIGDHRLLLLGHKGVGKTSLATRLLYSGHCIEGDEIALERSSQVIALPRLFHLKPGIERQVPELEPVIGQLPTQPSGAIDILALDPTVLGFDWRIDAGPIDTLIWIIANHGGQTRLEPCAPFEMIRYILESSLGWGETRDVLVAAASRLGRNGGYTLILGNTHDAAHRLESEFLCAC